MRPLSRRLMPRLLIAALFLLPVIILLPHLAQFPYAPGSSYSDLAISHYPDGLYIQQSLQQWHTLPLWSPTILSGYPFAANPLAGLYYLPGLLALLFPLPLGFNLLIVLHLLWGGVGMYRLLRLEGLAEPGALLGALTFEALPKLYSHLAAGHLTLLYAIAWTPWLLAAETWSARQANRRLRWALPGLVLGLITLADVRWAAYAGLLWLFYSLRCAWPGLLSRNAPRWYAPHLAALGRWLGRLACNVIFAGLVAAPLLLPLGQYTALSTRSQMTAQENLVLSLPPGQLFGLAYPPIGGTAEWMLYPGAVTLALVLFVLGRRAARRSGAFWLALAAASLIYALGSYLPPLALLARLPGLDLLRVPPRALFLAGFCLAAVAGLGLQHLLLTLRQPKPAPGDRSGLLVFAAAAFVLLLAVAVALTVQQPLVRVQFLWGGLFLLIGAVVILLARARRLAAGTLLVLVFSASLVDLIGVNALGLDFRPVQAVLSEGQAAVSYIRSRSEPGLFRVYSPSYSVPQQVAAWNGLQLADGVDPLQLAAYTRFMESAAGVTGSGYSVTLPPYANADPAADNQSAVPDARKLGLLNVSYVVAEFPLPENGLMLLARFGRTRVYGNTLALPRAWVQSADSPLGQSLVSIPTLEERPNSIALQAQGPGLLVLSEIAYPGWQAVVDGHPAPVETVGGLLRGVRLADGKHTVRLDFRPLPLYLGLALAGAAWVVFLAFFLIPSLRSAEGQ